MFHSYLKKKYWRKFTTLRDMVLGREIIVSNFTDDELRGRFQKIRELIRTKSSKEQKNKYLNKFLVEVFSLVRECIFRKTGLKLFHTQILGGIILHHGNIAQMKTGEGKTLTAILPICLNSLADETVFVVTVNEYLANRDRELAKPIFDFFAISSSVNKDSLKMEEKIEMYKSSLVIYTTGSGACFNELKSRLSNDPNRIESKYRFCIIDEIDFILLDGSASPFIISNQSNKVDNEENFWYFQATKLGDALREKFDYEINLKQRNVSLTKIGREKVEIFFKIDNLFSFDNHFFNFVIHSVLKSKHFYRRDIDYVVSRSENKIIPINSLNGRLSFNTVYQNGIQQSIESREGVKISNRSKTLASITYQTFFRSFEILSGMTGTAAEESEIFREVYGMEVFVVPPYKKSIRKDYKDLFFANEELKNRAIISLVRKYGTKGRPILIGTNSVESSERLSTLLKKENINHQKLNAVNHEKEAEIISLAGQIGAVTISTNMAGRGTDIMLSQESKEAGGLLVIGTRSDNNRADNQLIGRAARKGNPGGGVFVNSLQDNTMNFIEKEKLVQIFKFFEIDYKLASRFFSLLIKEIQEVSRNSRTFSLKQNLDYDLLTNRQRKIIHSFRDSILNKNYYPDEQQEKEEKREIDDFRKREKYLKEIKNRIFKRLLLRRVDEFWSLYLENLEREKILSSLKTYLSRDPKESFFWEAFTMFKENFSKLIEEMREIKEIFLKDYKSEKNSEK